MKASGGSGNILLAAAVADVVLLVHLRFDGRNMLSLPFFDNYAT